MSLEDITMLVERLDRIEAAVSVIAERQTIRDWYATNEFAQLVGKAEFTVREWCRLGRVRAEKKGSGRGKYQSWVVSHDELLRYQREGLIPILRALLSRTRNESLLEIHPGAGVGNGAFAPRLSARPCRR